MELKNFVTKSGDSYKVTDKGEYEKEDTRSKFLSLNKSKRN